jgi:hypothetical protein
MKWFTFPAILAIAAVLMMTNGILSSAQGIPKEDFVAVQNLNTGASQGYAVLSINQSTVKLGKKYSIEIRFYNTRGGEYFYNPFFQKLIPLPGQLAIYDKDKNYIADLLTWQGGSRRTVGASDWTFVPSNCFVGTTLHTTAGYNPASVQRKLPEGEYYLQMIYFRAYSTAHRPAEGKSAPANFYQEFDRSSLLRSNAIKIRFTK